VRQNEYLFLRVQLNKILFNYFYTNSQEKLVVLDSWEFY
jgi:hypothetical protein